MIRYVFFVSSFIRHGLGDASRCERLIDCHCSAALVPKVGSPDRSHQHHLRPCYKCKRLATPHPDLLNESEALCGVRGPSRWFWWMLKCENYCYILFHLIFFSLLLMSVCVISWFLLLQTQPLWTGHLCMRFRARPLSPGHSHLS